MSPRAPGGRGMFPTSYGALPIAVVVPGLAPWLLRSGAGSSWTGFLSGTKYKFWIEGNGSSGPNREWKPMEGSLVHDSRGDSNPGRPLVLHYVQSKPLTFRSSETAQKSCTFESSDEQKMVFSVPHCRASNWAQIVAQRTNGEVQESRAGADNEYDQMRVLVLLHPLGDSPARQVLRKQSQTRCRCSSMPTVWSTPDERGAEEEMQVAR